MCQTAMIKIPEFGVRSSVTAFDTVERVIRREHGEDAVGAICSTEAIQQHYGILLWCCSNLMALKGQALVRLRGPQQPNTKCDNAERENRGPDVDQDDRAAGLRGAWRQHRKEETRRDKNCRKWHSDSNEPQEGCREHSRVREHLANQLQDHNHACMSMPGAEEILS
jgi:hypothetical protein